jgi:hypothetical protein
MDKVQPSNSVYHTPSSEPYRIYAVYGFMNETTCLVFQYNMRRQIDK